MEYGTFLASELFAMSSAAVHTGRPIIKRAASELRLRLSTRRPRPDANRRVVRRATP